MIVCHCCTDEGICFFRTQEKQVIALCELHFGNVVMHIKNRDVTDRDIDHTRELLKGAIRICKEHAIIMSVMQE